MLLVEESRGQLLEEALPMLVVPEGSYHDG